MAYFTAIRRYLPFALGLLAFSCHATDLTFGLVAKTKDDFNFQRAWQGCQTAASADGNRCILIGATGAANPRAQLIALRQAMSEQHFDGLAISVTQSEFLADALRGIDIPVISFDSPFKTDDRSPSQAYVGIDNRQLGAQLAHLAQQLYPHGGTVCLMTAALDANLEQRITGIRQTLSGAKQWPTDKKLSGEQGWYECDRSPWNTADDIARARDQVNFTLDAIKPDVLIAAGHWPVADIPAFKQAIAAVQTALISGKTKLLLVIGARQQAEIDQLVAEKLLHGYLQIDFYTIGQLSYQTMKSLREGKTAAANVYVDVIAHSAATGQP